MIKLCKHGIKEENCVYCVKDNKIKDIFQANTKEEKNIYFKNVYNLIKPSSVS